MVLIWYLKKYIYGKILGISDTHFVVSGFRGENLFYIGLHCNLKKKCYNPLTSAQLSFDLCTGEL
jgi:hypothetical protein